MALLILNIIVLVGILREWNKLECQQKQLIREVERVTEHKRLTTKEKYPHGAEGVSKDKLTGKYCRGVFEATACVEKLAEYETAEEEGRLVVLPCKVGQCVYTNFSMSGWYMRKGKRPYIGRIVFIGLNVDDPYFNIILGEGKMLQFKFSEIGKRVFLAREEAEKALEEMEKDE